MTRRKVKENSENEARLQEAIVEYKKQQKSGKASLNGVAKGFNVPQ